MDADEELEDQDVEINLDENPVDDDEELTDEQLADLPVITEIRVNDKPVVVADPDEPTSDDEITQFDERARRRFELEMSRQYREKEIKPGSAEAQAAIHDAIWQDYEPYNPQPKQPKLLIPTKYEPYPD